MQHRIFTGTDNCRTAEPQNRKTAELQNSSSSSLVPCPLSLLFIFQRFNRIHPGCMQGLVTDSQKGYDYGN